MDKEDDFEFRPRGRQGEAPTSTRHQRRRRWQGKNRPRSAEAHRWLDEHFLEEARAGASDDAIVRASGLSKATVVRWRLSHGIKRTSRQTALRQRAVNLLGSEDVDVLHRSDDSPVGGQWEPPEYVIRRPLNYESLAKHLWFLWTRMGSSTKALAEAFGIREKDVQFALDLYFGYLDRSGRPCEVCGVQVAPTDRYCSKGCWDKAREGDTR